jgi:hypothetical protein
VSRARLIELAARRAGLVADARLEREALAVVVAKGDALALRGMRVMESFQRIADEVRARPLFALAAVAALVALKPRRALSWVLKGWSVWRMYRGAQRWWQGYMSGMSPNTPR